MIKRFLNVCVLENVNSNIGITVKRKPQHHQPQQQSAGKKGKKPSSSSNSVPQTTNSFDFEATICPICDEACTCPKTTSTTSSVTTNIKTSSNVNKKPVQNSKLKLKKSTVKPKKSRTNKKKIIEEELEDYVEDDDTSGNNSEPEEIIEDPALSFIRMIYSDEESLDEEEAYALYQATQLFSSSEEEEEGEGYYSECDSNSYSNSYTSSYESSDDSEEYEYTVVEYVQPSRKKKPSTEFVAYETDSDTEPAEGTTLLLNAKDPESDDDCESLSEEDDDDDEETCSNSPCEESDEESNENWLTYSVFDVDRDLILTAGQQQAQIVTSLSSHGSGTPETLLFSTSSTDKIPNIAPQVLAAISAAAKHMANNNPNSSNPNGSSKYFSYITLKDPLRGEEVNEEEFLFFEEEGDQSDCSDECEIEDFEELSIVSDSLSSDIEEEDGFTNTSSTETDIAPTTLSVNKTVPVPVPNYSLPLNRWNRVPIGAFRRSRRPSIPNPFHQIHPSTALKTFSDPTSAALTLTLTTPPSTSTSNAHINNAGEDSFDEAASTTVIPDHHRAYSVVTWDELDMDIVTNPVNNSPNRPNSPLTGNNIWPLPKRSRSVMAPSLSNNYEWLNSSSNWNWEI